MSRAALTWLGLLCGAAGLILQFTISIQAHTAAGRDLPGTVGILLSYYTILTNIGLVLVYLSSVTSLGFLDIFRRPDVRGMFAACITLMGLYVFFVLRHLSQLEGPFLLADTIPHYVCPTIYLAWWTLVQRHGQLSLSQLPVLLAPTLVYFIYAMARGAWVQLYPYPILNAIELGYGQVLVNAIYMTIGLSALMILVIYADRLLGRRWSTVDA